MSDKKRFEEVMNAIKAYTIKVTASPEAARAALVEEGIYNPDGTLHKNYGGGRITSTKDNPMKGDVTISKKLFYELSCAQEKLNRLEHGGIGNWDWYDDSLDPDGEQTYSEFCKEEKKRIENL